MTDYDDDDSVDLDTIDSQDTEICPYCGDVMIRMDGAWVCDDCGPVEDEEIDSE